MNIVIVGKSASGKTTMANYLSENFRYNKAVTATTRDKRKDEVDGIDYYFLTEKEFNDKISNDEFVEWAEYRGWKYGTPKNEIYGENKIFVLNPDGLKSFKRHNIKCLVILLESQDGLRVIRQVKRGDNIKEIERRYYTDNNDFQNIREYVDFVVQNNKSIEKCIYDILLCILYYKNKNSRDKIIKEMKESFIEINCEG